LVEASQFAVAVKKELRNAPQARRRRDELNKPAQDLRPGMNFGSKSEDRYAFFLMSLDGPLRLLEIIENFGRYAQEWHSTYGFS